MREPDRALFSLNFFYPYDPKAHRKRLRVYSSVGHSAGVGEVVEHLQ